MKLKMEVECPHCRSLLEVTYSEDRKDKPKSPDWSVTVKAAVLKQGKLFPESKKKANAKPAAVKGKDEKPAGTVSPPA